MIINGQKFYFNFSRKVSLFIICNIFENLEKLLYLSCTFSNGGLSSMWKTFSDDKYGKE